MDAGSRTIGLSATTEKKELFAAEVELRNDISKKISKRAGYRGSRRSRKLRHRHSRFDNRRRPKGWLAPSVRHKRDTHKDVIDMVYRILPVSELHVELAPFDIQKIQNPDISGKEYQQGPQSDFWNTREYVLYRDNHTCQHCKGKSKDKILETHHIESRKNRRKLTRKPNNPMQNLPRTIP